MKRRLENLLKALKGLQLQEQAKTEKRKAPNSSTWRELEEAALRELKGKRKEANSLSTLIKNQALGPPSTITLETLETYLHQGRL